MASSASNHCPAFEVTVVEGHGTRLRPAFAVDAVERGFRGLLFCGLAVVVVVRG
jgi:hypothetical protein